MTSNHNLAECRSTTKINLPNEIMQITSWHGLLNRDFSVPSRSSIAFDVISRKVYGGSNDETCLGIYCSDRLFSFFIRRIWHHACLRRFLLAHKCIRQQVSQKSQLYFLNTQKICETSTNKARTLSQVRASNSWCYSINWIDCYVVSRAPTFSRSTEIHFSIIKIQLPESGEGPRTD